MFDFSILIGGNACLGVEDAYQTMVQRKMVLKLYTTYIESLNGHTLHC